MTTGALLPAPAYASQPKASNHQRQPSLPPTPSSYLVHVFHLVRRSTLVQLMLALVLLGLVGGTVRRSTAAAQGKTTFAVDAVTHSSDGLLDIGGGVPPKPVEHVHHEAVQGDIGVEVGWDHDGVYRVLTDATSSSMDASQGLSSLGLAADRTFKLLSSDSRDEYWSTLQLFTKESFGEPLRSMLVGSLEAYRTSADKEQSKPMTDYKTIWQTDKVDSTRPMGNWQDKNSDWAWSLFDDKEADEWVRKRLGDGEGQSKIVDVWNEMDESGKGGILKSDMLRYLLMLVEGGVYTDTDTSCLKAIDQWGRNPRLVLPDHPRSKGEPRVIIGVEADVGTREDWNDWWPRPLQFVQWTISSSPHHPIFIDVLRRISLSNAQASTWLDARTKLVDQLRAEGKIRQAADVQNLDVFETKGTENEYAETLGPGVSVMEWTGPGVWTDSVMSYLKAEYGLSWPAFKDLRRPLRVGEISILPVTGFSPGVGLFGAQATWNEEAMVEHKFKGSWKHD